MMNSVKYTALIFSCALILASVILLASSDGIVGKIMSEKVLSTTDSIPVPAEKKRLIDEETLSEKYGKLPINFEPNVGQTDESVRFLARGAGYSLFLKDDQVLLSLQKPAEGAKAVSQSTIRMRMSAANPSPQFEAIELAEARTNYLTGNDPSQWHTDVANYAKVRSHGVLPGIDAIYYGNERQLEYDFVVAPGSDPSAIKLTFDGAEDASIDNKTGDLVLETGVGSIRQLRPVVYQKTDDGRTEIAASYALTRGDNEFHVSFNIADYDQSKELIIDPILAYGSYLGGNAFDEGRSIAADAAGNAYIVGTSASLNFPTTPGTIKTANPPSTNNVQWYDAFVTKMNPTGTALVWSTYYGGRNGSETGTGVAVDPNGNVIVSGTTMSNDLPVVNAYQPTFGGTDDAFAVKLNSTGSAIIYSTYLGGNNTDTGGRIALNRTTGDAVFAGSASSGNFPTTPGAYKPQLCNNTPGSCNGIFYSGSYMVRLSANGNIVYSTLFDANITDIALDAADNAVFGGSVSGTNFPATAGAFQTTSSGGIEGFVAKLNLTGSGPLVFGTYLGGGLQSDVVKGLTLDSDGNIYVAGQTENTGFPTTAGALDRTYNGAKDGFVTKFNAAGSALVYSTFLGGPGKDEPFAIDLAPTNEVFVTGETLSGSGFPLKNSISGANSSVTIFLTRLNADASALIFSSLLGSGGGYDVAADAIGNAYITGHTTSIPVTLDAFQTMKGEPSAASSTKDAFVMKIAPADEGAAYYSISGTVTDPTQFGNYQPITVTLTGPVSRSIVLPYGNGSGVIPYYFGAIPAGGNYTVTAHKIGFTTLPESVEFTNLGANQFADFTIQANQPPEDVITSPAHGTTFNAPASITIQATASDPDGDAIAKVDFVAYSSDVGSINIGTDTTAPYEVTWNNVGIGTWALYAFPTDSKGLRGDSVEVVHVFVIDAGGVNVAITSPTEGQTFAEGTYVPMAVDVSSSVTLVEVRDQNNQLVARMTGSPWQSTWQPHGTGSYTLTATASNAQGQTAASTPVNVVVTPMNHRISGRVYDNITLNPIAGVKINLVSPSNPTISRTATTDSTGSYLFTDLGATINDSVTITPQLAGYTFDPPTRSIGFLGYIDWPNQSFAATFQTGMTVNLTSPTDGQEFVAPATVAITVDVSTTIGSIARVEFYKRDGNGTILLGSDTTAAVCL